MSLHHLLQECGGGDDCAGSDTDLWIGDDDDSPRAVGTSFPAQEHKPDDDDDADHLMDVVLDSSPSAQSKRGYEDDRARPLRRAAEEQQERQTPGTPVAGVAAAAAPDASGTPVAGVAAAAAPDASGPTPTETPGTPTAGGGAAAPASGRTPTASRPEYSADAMAATLAVIPLEGKTVDEVASAVVSAFQEVGVEMRRCDSKKSSKEPGGRMTVIGLACKHGMKNRQREYREADAANGIKRRKSSSQRSNCPCKVFVRWPVRGENSEHPYLSDMNNLEHNHPVEKDAVDEVRRQNKPLDTPTKEACEALTDAGFKPAVQSKMLQALTGERPNPRAIRNAAAAHARRKTMYDANELLQKVKDATADGGKYLLKMDAEGRMTHLFWMTAVQVVLSIKYGHVLLYDDTAVKNKYRLPVGIGAVIDGEYFTRIAFQMIASDTQSETFEWMMEAWKEARGAEPDVFIQDADSACTLAAEKVFPGATKLRCQWHLWKNVKEKLTSVLKGDYPAFADGFHKMRGRLSETGFEESFEELCDKFPKAEKYLRHLYKDRRRWAAAFSVLTFSVSSFTSSRVEGINKMMKQVCGAMTSLQGVFEFFDGTLERQEQRASLRAARLALPTVSMPQIDTLWFGEKFMSPIRFGLGLWPFRFMTLEMEASAIFCGGANSVLEGDERLQALGKLEFLGELVVGVETVAVIMESRDQRVMQYIVCGMEDGSHVCSCRTLQELGLCCRHFWQAMRLSPKFKFHVGILNRHWLTEHGLRELETWPPECKPQWMVALNHSMSKDDQVRAPTVPVGSTWQAIPENATIECRLQTMAQTGQTDQNRRLLYVEMLKKATATVSAGVQTVPPETMRAIVQTFESSMHTAAMISSGQGAVLGNPQAVRQPAVRSQGTREKSSSEYGGPASRRRAQNYSG